MRTHVICRALLGCGLCLMLAASIAFAQPRARQLANPPLPEGLKHVPEDALGFAHFRAGDFLKSEIGRALLHELQKDREAMKGLTEIENTLGISAADLESMTILMLTPAKNNPQMRWNGGPRGAMFKESFPAEIKMPIRRRFDKGEKEIEEKPIEEKKAVQKESPVLFQPGGPPAIHDDDSMQDPFEVMSYLAYSGPLVIVTSTKPVDRRKVLRSQFFAARPRDPYEGRASQNRTVLFLSDRSVMMGAAWELGRYSELMARNPGPKLKPMQSALALGVEPHLLVAGGHLSVEMRRMILVPFGPDSRALAPLTPLMQTEAGLALDLGKSIDLTLQFNAPNETNAAHALQAVKSLQVLAELALEKTKEAGESGGAKLELEKALAKTLANAVIEQKGTTIKAQLKLEISPAIFKHVTKDIVATFRLQGNRTQSVNNLKEIGLALHSYHDANKRLPPAGLSSINDPTGKPLLSWRVAILPYIEQGPLYQQFDLTQSWDSPQNKKLIAKMPQIYLMPEADTKEGETHYRVLVGPSTIFEPGVVVTMVSITDGTSNTIMAVEAKEPTIWTRPDDLPFDPKGPLPKLGTTPEGFNALFGDGTVRFIRSNTPVETIRALITRNGGEPAFLPDDK